MSKERKSSDAIKPSSSSHKRQSASGPSKSGGSMLDKFRQECLEAHNVKRQMHNAPPVELKEDLNVMAQKWADQLAKTGKFEHSPEKSRPGAGENIASHSNMISGQEVVEMWYSEIKDYDFKKPGFAANTGHFTQLVWVGCSNIGVGMSLQPSKKGMYMYVTNYTPHGNILGRFESNVLPLASSDPKISKSAKNKPKEQQLQKAPSKVNRPDSRASIDNHRNSRVSLSPENSSQQMRDPHASRISNSPSLHNTRGSFSKGPQDPSSSTPKDPFAPKGSDQQASPVSKQLLDRLREETLIAHNQKRQLHGAPPVRLSEELNKMAQNWAETLLQIGTFQHSAEDRRKGAGENIAAHSQVISGEQLVDMWYVEADSYNFKKPGFASNTGHFTQVVWKTCNYIGVGMSPQPGPHGMYIYVVNYWPHGNVLGQFETNVLPRGTPAPKRSSAKVSFFGLPRPQTLKASRHGKDVSYPQPQRMESVLSKLRKETLAAHNKRRQWHDADPVQLSDILNKMAQNWAENLARSGTFRHSPEDKRGGSGENIAAHSNILSGEQLVEMWYGEIKDYNFNRPGFALNTGHFTQVIWKNCKFIGVGMSLEQGPHGMYAYVTNYWPHGNVLGQFDANVLPRIL